MRRPYSSAFTSIGLSPIVAISEQIRSLAPGFEKGGQTFAYLQRGELADPTPDFVIDATKRALDAGLTRYPKAGGEPWFKEAVVAHMAAEHGITDIGPEHVICTYGGQEGLQLVFGLLGGGRVLSFGPAWSCVLENIFPYTGFEVDTLDLIEDHGRLRVDFDALDRKLALADVLYLNTPQNPSGKVFSREELERIDALCRKHGVRIVSDEAYKDFVFDGREHVSPLSLPGDHIIGVYTCSKSFASTGFRIGFTICRDRDLIARLILGEYTQTAGVVPFIQRAFADVLVMAEPRHTWQAALVAALQRRRDLIAERLGGLFSGGLYRPEGAFYFFLNLQGLVPPPPAGVAASDHIVARFLEQGIAVVPGTAFGDERYAHHVRLSFSGVGDAVLESALGRMTNRVLLQAGNAAG
ncbi:MAG: pyridoxal phosphate-dependent aminotransferase [Candidatus Krumholzibacteriia bacterium]